jgi:hypothetical protein
LRKQTEKAEKKLYKPKINSKSKEIVNRHTNRSFNGDDIHERLYRQGIKNLKKENYEYEPDLQECTFTPNLVYSSIQGGGNIDDFLERQKIYDEIKRERLEKKLSKSIDDNTYTFKPEINLTSDIIIKADTNRANENTDERVNRLYKQNYDKIKTRKEQLESFYYSQYDFKPKINHISKIVGKEHSIEELATRNASKAKIKRVAEDDIEECTFKPILNQNKHVQSSYKFDENILDRIQQEMKTKNEKVEELKR